MAEILLRAQAQIDIPADSEKAARLREPGDVVVVRPSGHPWGSKEGLPRFWRVNLHGISDLALKFLERPQVAINGRITKKSRYRVDLTKLPKQIRDELNATGVVTVTMTQAVGAFIDRNTGGAAL